MNKPNQGTASSENALKYARHWHEQWNEKLREAVKTKESVDPSVIERDDCCELGKWLYAVDNRRYGSKPEFQNLLLNHREFHLLAGAVAQVINAKQYELAEAYLSEDTQLARSSREVDAAIGLLQAAVLTQ